jgi:L-histidine N-alpha-methyltransferase
MNQNDRILIGVDCRKDKKILEAAYDDRLGVTAKFNLNLLERINKELNANFSLQNFEHVADYNVDDGYVRMYLKSKVKQFVNIGNGKVILW